MNLGGKKGSPSCHRYAKIVNEMPIEIVQSSKSVMNVGGRS